MKYIVFLLLLVSSICYGQTTYYIQADTVRFRKNIGNSEFVLENSTRNIVGPLINKGNGRTGFARGVDSVYLTVDSLLVVRYHGNVLDTITSLVGGGGGGGANNYPTSISFSNNRLSLARNGLSTLTADWDSTKYHSMGFYDLRYQGLLTLTTTGTSGAATLIGNTLNIPQYAGGGGTDNANVGSGFRILKPSTQELKTLFGSNTIAIDSATNANGLTIAAITQMSITSDASGLKLVNDASTPAIYSYYGTDSLGTKGFVKSGLNYVANKSYVSTNAGFQGLGKAGGANGRNIFIGDSTGWDITTGQDNVALGFRALTNVTSAIDNFGAGWDVLYHTTTGSANFAAIQDALYNNTTGGNSIAIGRLSLYSNTTGGNNIALGYASGTNHVTGDNNIFIGRASGEYNTTGSFNTYMGYGSGGNINENATIPDYATLIGYEAGNNNGGGFHAAGLGRGVLINASGIGNMALGYQAGNNITTGTYNLVLGYDIDAPSATANGQLSIQNIIFGTGNTATGTTVSSGSIGIGVPAPTTKFDIGGDLRVRTVLDGGPTDSIASWDNGILKRIARSEFGGITPTLEQVLTAGSTLTTAHTIIAQPIPNHLTIQSGAASNHRGILLIDSSSITWQLRKDNVYANVNFLDGGIGNFPRIVIQSTESGVAESFLIINRDSIDIKPNLGKLNIDTLRSATDTTLYKPMVWKPTTGDWDYLTYWPVGTGGSGGGDVFKVGTPVNDQIGVWTGDGTIEGTSGLKFNGNQVDISGTSNPGFRVYNSGADGWYFYNGVGAIAGDFGMFDIDAGKDRLVITNNGTIKLGNDADISPYFTINGTSGNITATGSIGIGGAPTARLNIAAGTASANTAPIKLTSGTALSSPEDGAMEYHSSHLWFTIGSTRYQLDQQTGGGGVSDGDKGDITVSASGATWTIDNSAVTLAKIANIGDQTILGNNTGGSAAPIALTAAQTKTLLSLNNVENTALSTWAGTTNITTLGTITSGTWQGGVISSTYGGMGINNGGRTLTLNTNSGTITFTNAATTLTVANTGSISGTNTGDQTTVSGNAGTATALQNARTLWGQSFDGTANVTGNITLSTASITMTGSIGATGARVTKGWFTDAEFTNMPTVGGTSLSSTFSPIAGSASITTVGTLSSGSIPASLLTGSIATARMTNISQPHGVKFVSPTASENQSMVFNVSAMTVTDARVVVVGSSPSVTYTVHYGTTYGTAVGTVIASNTVTATGTPTINTSSIPANSYIWVTTSATSGVVDDFTIILIMNQQ